ncbi:hypothetical protein C2G38_2187860 [Gigaspora rosea]|uniref:Sel1 repeat protein n=1 Tax=Gigaspora rosea TaxID=44941 RepID=A0A397V5B5_9GLOM|nr:hypothetical protein C2G38_2187860 [Gigaspora rosea]
MDNTIAMNNVGCCYYRGIEVEKDGHKAFEYLQKSVKMGDADAIDKTSDQIGEKNFEVFYEGIDEMYENLVNI